MIPKWLHHLHLPDDWLRQHPSDYDSIIGRRGSSSLDFLKDDEDRLKWLSSWANSELGFKPTPESNVNDGIVNVHIGGSTGAISTTEYEPGIVKDDIKDFLIEKSP